MVYGRDLIKRVFKEMRDRSDFLAGVAPAAPGGEYFIVLSKSLPHAGKKVAAVAFQYH
jgi:hypothetical protein